MGYGNSLSTCEEHDKSVVVYSGSKCPLCESEENLKEAEKESADNRKECDKLEDQVAEVQAELDKINAHMAHWVSEQEGRKFREEAEDES